MEKKKYKSENNFDKGRMFNKVTGEPTPFKHLVTIEVPFLPLNTGKRVALDKVFKSYKDTYEFYLKHFGSMPYEELIQYKGNKSSSKPVYSLYIADRKAAGSPCLGSSFIEEACSSAFASVLGLQEIRRLGLNQCSKTFKRKKSPELQLTSASSFKIPLPEFEELSSGKHSSLKLFIRSLGDVTGLPKNTSLKLPFFITKQLTNELNRGSRITSVRVVSGEQQDRLLMTFTRVIIPFSKKAPTEKLNILGVDLGQRNLIACSDGTLWGEGVGNLVNHLKYLLAKRNPDKNPNRWGIRKNSRSQVYRKSKSRNNNRQVKEMERIVLSFVKHVYKTYPNPLIVLEDLRGIKNKNKRVPNWLIGETVEFLKRKLTEYGIFYITWSPYNTSRDCSHCDWRFPPKREKATKNPRTLDIFNCPKCGVEDHADINAARNIANRASSVYLQKVFNKKLDTV